MRGQDTLHGEGAGYSARRVGRRTHRDRVTGEGDYDGAEALSLKKSLPEAAIY